MGSDIEFQYAYALSMEAIAAADQSGDIEDWALKQLRAKCRQEHGAVIEHTLQEIKKPGVDHVLLVGHFSHRMPRNRPCQSAHCVKNGLGGNTLPVVDDVIDSTFKQIEKTLYKQITVPSYLKGGSGGASYSWMTA